MSPAPFAAKSLQGIAEGTMPSEPDFSTQDRTWAQIDHQRVLLKTNQAAIEFGVKYSPRLNEYRKGNAWSDLVAMGKAYIEWAKEWTEKLFVIYTEVWEEQGKVRTPDFLRALLNKALVPEIEKRLRPAKSEITQATRRKREFSSGLTGLLNRLEVDAGTLRNEWRRRIETQVRELQLKQVQRPAQVEEVATVGKGDWLFDLASWRRVCPEDSFEPFLQQCKSYLYEQLPKVPTAQLRRWLSYYEAYRAALVRAYAYLESYWQSEPSEPEEQDFHMCEMVLPLLRLEIARRGENLSEAEKPTKRNSFDSKNPVIPHAPQQGLEILDRHGPAVTARLTIIHKSLKQDPRMSAEDLCKRLDVENHPPLDKWREDYGVTTWTEAYAKPELHEAVQAMLSKAKNEIKRLTDLPSKVRDLPRRS